MRLKLDENLEPRLAQAAAERGHDALGVLAERISGISDDTLFVICRLERRVLVTLDLDFADVLRFPPRNTAGIIVLRPGRSTRASVRALFDAALELMDLQDPTGVLWIVEPGQVRVRGISTEETEDHA